MLRCSARGSGAPTDTLAMLRPVSSLPTPPSLPHGSSRLLSEDSVPSLLALAENFNKAFTKSDHFRICNALALFVEHPDLLPVVANRVGVLYVRLRTLFFPRCQPRGRCWIHWVATWFATWFALSKARPALHKFWDHARIL